MAYLRRIPPHSRGAWKPGGVRKLQYVKPEPVATVRGHLRAMADGLLAPQP
jgi:hypothetical protein